MDILKEVGGPSCRKMLSTCRKVASTFGKICNTAISCWRLVFFTSITCLEVTVQFIFNQKLQPMKIDFPLTKTLTLSGGPAEKKIREKSGHKSPLWALTVDWRRSTSTPEPMSHFLNRLEMSARPFTFPDKADLAAVTPFESGQPKKAPFFCVSTLAWEILICSRLIFLVFLVFCFWLAVRFQSYGRLLVFSWDVFVGLI